MIDSDRESMVSVCVCALTGEKWLSKMHWIFAALFIRRQALNKRGLTCIACLSTFSSAG